MADSPASRLGTLFRGLTRAHGVYIIPSGAQANAQKAGKIEGQAKTLQKPVTEAVWAAHIEGKRGVGIVPVTDEGLCYFAAIDIDVYPLDMNVIEKQCAQFGLPLLPTRTKSGGVHLYLFSKEGISAALVRRKLGEWTVALGYAKSEIFPKQDEVKGEGDVGNWINMPYFNAASGATNRYGVLNGMILTLSQYCDRADKLSITAEQLEQLDLAQDKDDDDFVQAPPCLQCLARNKGLIVGARNNGLFAVGVYLRKRFPDDWKQRLYAYNGRYSHPPMAEAEIKVIAKSVGRKKYNFNCNELPIKTYCNRSICLTREFGVSDGEEEKWGVNIDSESSMVNTKPPYWLVGINGVQVKFFAEDLQMQQRFQRLCMEHVKYLPPLLPSGKWNKVVNTIISTAKLVEAPEDASTVGELSYHLRQFCTVFPQGETREEILVGKPYTEESVTYFRAGDFKRYLESQRFHGLNGGAHLYSELRELGVEYGQLWIQEQNLRVWKIPSFAHNPVEVPPRRVSQENGSM